MYAIHPIDETLWQIALDAPPELPAPLDHPTNVYLLGGGGDGSGSPALVNVGHPAQFAALSEALRELGVSPSAIERIVYTSWRIDAMGGATNFPRADHFALSPDMVAPRRYESWLATQREDLRGIGLTMLESEAPVEAWRRERLDEVVGRWLPPSTDEFAVIPLRDGHTIAAGSLRLEVVAAPGPNPGHALLFDASKGYLFSGELAMSGLPEAVERAEPYLIAIERAQGLEPTMLLPNHGDAVRRAAWHLKRISRFANNFLSNLAAALVTAPTLDEFVARDQGHRSDDLAEHVLAMRRYRPFLDELVTAGMIKTEGEGLERRYGVDVEDPRDPRLR